MKSLQSDSLLVPVVAVGVAVLAVLWFLAIAPKRSEHARVAAEISSQQARLDEAKSQVDAFTASRKRFPGLLAELRAMDVAVPARGEISNLLREVQRRARLRDSDLRLASLKGASASVGAGTAVTPGAQTGGPEGLSMLPFSFAYTGKYFNLLSILRAARQAVSVRSGDLAIDGRLLTIDGLSFQRVDPRSPLMKAAINATAYIAGDRAPAAPSGAGAAAPDAQKAGS